MHSEHNPLLAQVPLTVSPFITLPKAPTLPHNYATIPSTLPPSILSTPPASSTQTKHGSADPDTNLPAYVTSTSGFRAHPSTVLAQNTALRDQLATTSREAHKVVQSWLDSNRERELAEKRRKAPGWLDSEEKMLSPQKPAGPSLPAVTATPNLMDSAQDDITVHNKEDAEVNDLGAQMDRAFG